MVTRCAAEIGSPFEVVTGPLELYQDSSGGENWQSTNHINRHRQVPVAFRGYRWRDGAATRHGLRATPIVQVQAAERRLTVTLPYFWQNFPKAIEAADGAIVVRLFPGQFGDLHELQGGEQQDARRLRGVRARPGHRGPARLVPVAGRGGLPAGVVLRQRRRVLPDAGRRRARSAARRR